MTRPAVDGGHGEWDALAVGWAMTALDPEDERRFAGHLATCGRCTATVRDALHTVADLAYALTPEPPPERLRQRIMEAAAAERAEHPTASASVSPAGVDAPGGPASAGRRAVPIDARDRAADPDQAAAGGAPTRPGDADQAAAGAPTRAADPDQAAAGGAVVPLGSRRRRWVRRAAVAAAVALLAAVGAWNVQLRSDQDRLRDAVAQRDAMVAQRDALVARLTDPGPARVAVIRGPGGTGQRRATVVVKDGRLGLITETLPPEPAPRTYWLWSLQGPHDADPVPLAGFTVPVTRFSACNIEPPAGVDVSKAFAISAEPGPDRPTRPTEVVAFGSTNPA